MPNNIINTFASKSGKSKKEVEKLWNDAKEIASEELGKSEKDFSDKEWAYTTGILKKMLKIKESIMKNKQKKVKSFLESTKPFKEYLEDYMSGFPGEDEEDIFYEDDAEYEDTYYDEYGNPVHIEFEVESEDDEIEETMTSGAFTSPKEPIDGTIINKDDELEDSYPQIKRPVSGRRR